MNLKQVYASVPEPAWPRPAKTFLCADHELVCLGYEEALRRGWDGEYGVALDAPGYFLEVLDCSLTEFCEILTIAEKQKQSTPTSLPLEPGRPETGGAL